MAQGISRTTQAWPDIELIDDRCGNQFKAIIWRPQSEQVTEQVGQKPAAKNEQVTEQVTQQVMNMLSVINGEMSRGEITNTLGLKDEKHFREHCQQAGITLGVIEMTLPDKPRSSKQRYRLTHHGQALLATHDNKEPKT
jgi:hypothetical protein